MLRNRIVLATAAMLIFVSAVGSTAAAVTSSGIGGRPANPDPKNPRTESIFIYTLDKGAVKQDAVNVINNTKETEAIEVYMVDGAISNDGAFTCKQRAEEQNGVGKWVELATNEVALESMQTQQVALTLTVPDDAEVGEHNGCVVFQKKNDPGEARGGVRVQTRQALRMAVTIPGNLYRDVTLRDFMVTQGAAGRRYHVTAHNVGNVSVDAKVNVGLKDIFGRTVTLTQNETEVQSLGGSYSIIPESKNGGKKAGRLELNFDEDTKFFWGGFYKAQASVQYNSDASSIGSQAGHTITKTTDEITLFIMPSLLVILMILAIILVIIALIAWLIGRRYGAAYREKHWGYHTVKQGETIESIARAYKIKWKKLARINELKAPYVLKPGRRVSVPIKRHRKR